MNPGWFTVFHIPHAATLIPPRPRALMVLSDDELAREVLAMTDLYTDELFRIPDSRGRTVTFPVSRLVVDPERFLDDRMEPMAERGMGVIYTRTSENAVLRHPPSPEERAELIDELYRPHHERLTEAVDACLETAGVALILDCHSFPSVARAYELDQSPSRPEICLGTDSYHTPSWLEEAARRLFLEAGFSVALNRPFSGALVPMTHYRETPTVHALMVEVNRGLYMEETTGIRRLPFESIRVRLQGVLSLLLDEVGEKSGASS